MIVNRYVSGVKLNCTPLPVFLFPALVVLLGYDFMLPFVRLFARCASKIIAGKNCWCTVHRKSALSGVVFTAVVSIYLAV